MTARSDSNMRVHKLSRMHIQTILQPQDIVHVPRSRIEEINLWVDKYINRTIPTGLDYSRQLDAKQAIGYSAPSIRN